MSLPSIEIAIQCCYFERRMNWMLSSLLQQTGEVPPLTISIAHAVNTGNPTSESVISYFRGRGLSIRGLAYQDTERLQYRGLTRNDALAGCTSDYVFFSYSDMVFSPLFFSELAKQLQGRYVDCDKVMSLSRVSLDKPHCIAYFDPVTGSDPWRDQYPCEVPDAVDIVKDWPTFNPCTRNCGAGYMQLCSMDAVRKKTGGIYVAESDCQDQSWLEGQKANSDKQFRKDMGLEKLDFNALPKIYHLNHVRDNEVGHHLTVQR